MSRLDELIAELCPDGVEYKCFGDIATIARGASPRPIKNFITNDKNGVNWIKIGDVKTGEKYITETEEKITLEGAKKSRKVNPGDFILSNSMSFGRPYILKTSGCIHDGWLAISGFSEYFDADFLYYLLNTSSLQAEMRKRASFGGAVQNLNADIVKALELPVPPLPVQQEIVRILDSFTELTAELTAELAARKKQYEYYRNSVFDNCDTEQKSIAEIAQTNIGLATSVTKHKREQGVILLHNSDIQQNAIVLKNIEFISEEFASKNSGKILHKDDIITVHTGDVGTSAVIDDKYDGAIGFTTITTRIKDKKQVLPAYLCHYLNSQRCKSDIASMTISDRNNLNQSSFEKLMIPIPSVEDQIRIISILDRFNIICNSVSNGLPAEITARQKQYEYYRDKLLTFKPLS